MNHTKMTRVVSDRTREPWTVEESAVTREGVVVLRYGHELGYEIVATAATALDRLTDRELVRILEEARHRSPPTVDAA